MLLHWLQHVPFEDLGFISRWAEERGDTVTCTRLYAGDSLPDQDSFEWLVVMGGPMNIYEHDKYPWLVKEKAFLKDAIDNGKTVIGICLGAQLIADVLGAKVYPGEHKEIGWFPVEFSETAVTKNLPQRADVFHWHGDTFDLPEGAVRFASSEACLNQGFVFGGRVLALQFHMETTRESARSLIENCANELVDAPYIQTAEEMLADTSCFDALNAHIRCLLDNLF
ncbi:MAG: type 1 glutamine amidotransferase [Verrucomicrobia bacterium]|nr:type 1 glutamine amidotransferase [Verrucomicrobiota bacterium]